MTGKFSPKIKDSSVFREIALNTVNQLEILREAISNSDDANAEKICINIDRDSKGEFIIEIEDDGDGMSIEEIHKFFNLGFSHKLENKIGEKGLGTKIFYKSNGIHIETSNIIGTAYIADMRNPWKTLLDDKVPEYEIKKVNKKINKGTKITILGYHVDNPEQLFNIDSIKDYIHWFTVGGSFRNVFANEIRLNKFVNNIHRVPQIIINDRINEESEIIVGIHQFEEPNENPILENIYLFKSDYYSRSFGPFYRATNINGEYVSVQIYGTVSGVKAREKVCNLKTEEEHKSRFGIYLSKDFIPCVRMNRLIHHDEYEHFHIMANSQVFKLTSDRNNISNINDIKVKWVISKIEEVVNQQIMPIAEREYFSMIKREREEYEIKKKCDITEKAIQNLEKFEDLGIDEIPILKQPRNEFETSLLFVAMLGNFNISKYMGEIKSIVSYSSRFPTDMICKDNNGLNILVEVEHKLSNFFKHNHPIEIVDYIICWEVNIDQNRPQCLNGKNCIIINEDDKKYLIFNDKRIRIIELVEIAEKLSLRSSTCPN